MHIKDNEWQAFYESGANRAEVLKHVADCDYCAGRMMDFLPESKILEPMPYLDDMILKETAKYSTQKQLASKYEFVFYCMKVGVAMCFALFILFTGDFTKINDRKPQDVIVETEHKQPDKKDGGITHAIRKTTGSISDMLNSLYFDISGLKFDFEREDNSYENTKK